jgi:hypothetical protein
LEGNLPVCSLSRVQGCLYFAPAYTVRGSLKRFL